MAICGNWKLHAQLYVTRRLYAAGFPSRFPVKSYVFCYYAMTAPAGTRIRFWITSFGTSHRSLQEFRLVVIEINLTIVHQLKQAFNFNVNCYSFLRSNLEENINQSQKNI